jgi:hypothetical protein
MNAQTQAGRGLEITGRGPLILLFFDGYDVKAYPGMLGAVRSQILRAMRFAKRTVLRQQLRTGYYTAFRSLVQSLLALGCDVRINDFAAARQRPHYPIGVAGFPSVFKRVQLPNPKLFGPGDFGRPDQCAARILDPQLRCFIVHSAWVYDLFYPYVGDKLWCWFVGIDTQRWPDKSRHTKRYDFVIYDKLYWQRDEATARILEPIKAYLHARKLTYTVLRYGAHHPGQFMQALSAARAMLFLCAQETQGMAYQEALACNIPVLALNEGKLMDPAWQAFAGVDAAVSSVPYFDATCGMEFTMDNFPQTCDAFIATLPSFEPRRYVAQHLSPTTAAQRYLERYEKIAGQV